jgi:hypothetical protein
MFHFEVESDRDVTVDAIGLLEAGVPVIVTEEMKQLFKVVHGVELQKANFPHFVNVTAVVNAEEVGGE